MSDDEPEPEREPHSRFLGALDAHKHVTDDRSRTTQTLRLMPWYFRFFIAGCIALIVLCVIGLIGLAELSGHLHGSASPLAIMRWAGGSVLGSTLITYGTMRLRRKLRKRPKTRELQPRTRARGKSACPRQVVQQHPPRGRPNPVGLPPGRDGNRQRHERPHGEKTAPRHDDRHQHP